MSILVASAALKTLISGLLEKIPGWIETERQAQREHEVITNFQAELHRLADTLTHVVEHQGDLIAQQQQLNIVIILHLLEDKFRNVALAGNSIASTGISQHLIDSIVTAHRTVIDAVPSLPPPPVEASVASLEVMARWQMTSATRFALCDSSLQFKGWTILAGVFHQSALYLAIKGNDPASAIVKYRPTMLHVYPKSTSDWEELLKQGLAQFDELIELPGAGIDDLVSRLKQRGIVG